ncbi:hypothetical protein EXIGLDRAFT_720271 [Exidia glandulosa HHB12029]|uniref:Uncharacterized protein n=1 Tax=Exidia glandulosa HHB12029 TaxID=1314781 RepID=A0A165GIL6_EXIGL|nr:hypothetical protein EXIGLDRAFT_720271 [Exidia glandulosa HHB12029]
MYSVHYSHSCGLYKEVAEDKLALQLAAPTPAQDPRRDSVTHKSGRRARDERSASPARHRERDESHRRRHSRSRSRSPSHRKHRSRREDGKQRDEDSRRRVKIESPS